MVSSSNVNGRKKNKQMKTRNKSKQGSNTGRNLVGLIIILMGILLLIDRLVPALSLGWLFSWPMILIIIGLVIGAQSKFDNNASYILIMLGGFFLLTNEFHLNIGNLLWPILLIALGFWLIKGRNRKAKRHIPVPPTTYPDDLVWDKRVREENATASESNTQETYGPEMKDKEPEAEPFEKFRTEKDDYVDSTSIFGDAKHYIVSQQFLGGEIVNIMGGATINLMRADLKGPATLEVVQLFGGTTIIAPAHWVVQPEMASIFGGIEDKRFQVPATPDHSKVLYIKGTSIFGGITIKSF